MIHTVFAQVSTHYGMSRACLTVWAALVRQARLSVRWFTMGWAALVSHNGMTHNGMSRACLAVWAALVRQARLIHLWIIPLWFTQSLDKCLHTCVSTHLCVDSHKVSTHLCVDSQYTLVCRLTRVCTLLCEYTQVQRLTQSEYTLVQRLTQMCTHLCEYTLVCRLTQSEYNLSSTHSSESWLWDTCDSQWDDLD